MRGLLGVVLCAVLCGCPSQSGEIATYVDGVCTDRTGCHPARTCLRGRCVKACDEAADCDATEKCTPVPRGADAGSYCACTAQTACPLSEEFEQEQVCHEAAGGVCRPPCADNSGCESGFRCDADAGRCFPAE